jgi:hypothetical protein
LRGSCSSISRRWRSGSISRSPSCASGVSLPEPARKRIRAIEKRYERIIQRVIEGGIASGEFRADLDARMATLALLGLGNSAAAWYGREPGATLERITASYVDRLVRAFRGGEAPPLRVRH